MRKLAIFLVKRVLPFAVLFSLAFGWGFLTHRERTFPWGLLKQAYLKSGLPRTGRFEIKAKTPVDGFMVDLPYVTASPDPNRQDGVLVFDEARAFPGYNFYNSYRKKQALLLDMQGRIRHRWEYTDSADWVECFLFPNGDILVLAWESELLKLDKKSNLIWSRKGQFHHSFWTGGPDSDIYVLNRDPRPVAEIHPTEWTVDDTITILSADGTLKDEISILNALQESAYAFVLPSLNDRDLDTDGRPLDILHTNHVEVFDGQLAPKSGLFAEGNILVSIRNINSIAIIDGSTRRVIWLWGPGNLTFQHHPALLENGNLLIFDNGLEQSQIIELNPLTRQVVWRYGPQTGFFTETRGNHQRLPNGNTLIIESNKGYVFEVTPEGEPVWVFANPDHERTSGFKFIPAEVSSRNAVGRMMRIEPTYLTFLPKSSRP